MEPRADDDVGRAERGGVLGRDDGDTPELVAVACAVVVEECGDVRAGAHERVPELDGVAPRAVDREAPAAEPGEQAREPLLGVVRHGGGAVAAPGERRGPPAGPGAGGRAGGAVDDRRVASGADLGRVGGADHGEGVLPGRMQGEVAGADRPLDGGGEGGAGAPGRAVGRGVGDEPVPAVGHELVGAREAGCEHRQRPAGEGLQQRDAEPLVAGGEHEQVGSLQGRPDPGRVDRPEAPDTGARRAGVVDLRARRPVAEQGELVRDSARDQHITHGDQRADPLLFVVHAPGVKQADRPVRERLARADRGRRLHAVRHAVDVRPAPRQ